MQKRQTVIEKFVTFYQVYPDTRWIIVPELQSNINRLLAASPRNQTFWQSNEIACLEYFLQTARDNSNPLAEKHLRAYLEEACYQSAQSAYRSFSNSDYTLCDYWQIAREYASNPVRVFKNCNLQRGIPSAYLQKILVPAIMDEIRKGKEAERASDWALLRRISKKALKTALQAAAINERHLSRCILAWQAFGEIYTPISSLQRNRQLQPPTAEQFAAMVDYYNEFRLLDLQEPAATVAEIQKLLNTCIHLVRLKTAIRFNSIDADSPGINLAMADKSEAILSRSEEEAEYSQQWEQLRQVLGNAIATLSPDAQKMLILEHGLEGFKQVDIAQIFSVPQYQISRQLKGHKKPLLTALAEWSQTNAGVTLTVEKVNELSQQLDDWLKWYYQRNHLFELLQNIFVQEMNDSLPLLRCHFGKKISIALVAVELNLSENTINEQLALVKKKLQKQVENWMLDSLKLPASCMSRTAKPIAKLVDTWLSEAPYSILEKKVRQ